MFIRSASNEPGEMLPSPRGLSSYNRTFFDIFYKFIGALRNKDALFPDDAKLARDLRTDRNLHEVPWIDRQSRIQQCAAGAAPQKVEDRIELTGVSDHVGR